MLNATVVLETDQPKLRFLVGEDAQEWITGRQRMPDETWVDYGQEMTDEDLTRFYRHHFNMDI
jgi:hypothetical protein